MKSMKNKVAVIGIPEDEFARRERLMDIHAKKLAKEKRLLSEKWREEIAGIGTALRNAGL